MAALATQNVVAAGTAPTFGAASASDTAEVGNGYNTFAVYRNSGATPATVTVVAPGNTSYGEPNPDPDFTLADGSGTPTEVWVPLRKEYDSGDGNGRATITVSPATDVTVAIVRVG
ncbi:hypothetical protein [Streptomyces sp. NPDC002666]